MRELPRTANLRFTNGLLPLLVIVAVGVAALPLLAYPLGRDQGMYANIGQAIVDGGLPYISMWDIKPPPIYYLYAGAITLFGSSVSAVRALDLLLIPVAMLALCAYGRQLERRGLGVLAALFLGVFALSDSFENLTQSDSLAMVPMVGAALTTLLAGTKPQGSRGALVYSLLTGLLCGVLLWFKQYYVFIVAAFALSHLWTRLREKPMLPVREMLAFSLGGLLTGGSLLVIFASQGILAEMLIIAQGTAAYNALGYDRDEFLFGMGNGLYSRWLRWSPLLILAAVGLVGWLARRGWRDGLLAGWRLALLWFVGGLAFLLVQAKGFDTHWLPLLPPLCLFAAAAISPTRERVRSLTGAQVIVGLGALAILIGNTWVPYWPYAIGQQSQVAYYEHFVAGDLRAAESLQVVSYLQRDLAPGSSLYIFGFRPEVAFMGGWRPATRFQAQFPLVAPWFPAGWRDETVTTLWAALPPVVLIVQNDYMPWVTGQDADSHVLLQDLTELNNWLMANYTRETQIGNFFIWRRNSTTQG